MFTLSKMFLIFLIDRTLTCMYHMFALDFQQQPLNIVT